MGGVRQQRRPGSVWDRDESRRLKESCAQKAERRKTWRKPWLAGRVTRLGFIVGLWHVPLLCLAAGRRPHPPSLVPLQTDPYAN